MILQNSYFMLYFIKLIHYGTGLHINIASNHGNYFKASGQERFTGLLLSHSVKLGYAIACA